MMVVESKNKLRLIKILEILRSETDETKPITTNELIKRLKSEGIDCRRETLYTDIELLNANGYEIMSYRGTSNQYWVADREFNVSEIRIIMDAVYAANFITEKKTNELIGKISQLAGVNQGALMANAGRVYENAKRTNEKIYYTVSQIEWAIRDKKKISFKYFRYDKDYRKVIRHGGQAYELSPYQLMVNSDNYYLIGYYERHDEVIVFRVDRIEDVMVLDDAANTSKCNDQSLSGVMFGMFRGQAQQVTIEISRELIDVVIDRFGQKLRFTENGDDKLIVTVNAQVSPQFIAWVNSFPGKMKVLSPQSVVDEAIQSLKALLAQYE